MSHLTTYNNNNLINVKKEMLEKSLAEIGIILDYEDRHIRNSYISDTVDAAFIVNGKRIAAGINFKKNNNGDEIVEVAGDFWGTGLNQEEITNKISQIYQKNNIIEKCKSQRWYVENENEIKENEDGEIVIQAYRYV